MYCETWLIEQTRKGEHQLVAAIISDHLSQAYCPSDQIKSAWYINVWTQVGLLDSRARVEVWCGSSEYISQPKYSHSGKNDDERLYLSIV